MGMLAPKTGTRLKEVEANGVDIMIALDVSRSMLAEDLGMSRLDLAKRTIERIVGSLDGDRAGLVVFAGDAYVQAPLTLDLAAVKLFLDAIGPEAIPVQGTAIGAAIEQCVTSFDPESQASKVIMILTDGENHEDDALARADEAAKSGIKVHAAGMASEAGGPIPEFDRYGRQTGYKEDQNGQPVVSTLDERMLVAMVEAGTGTYVRARSGYVDLSPFLDSLENLETGKTTKVAYTDYVHQFPWFFLIGLVLLLIEGLWPLASRKPIVAVAVLMLILPWPVQAQSSPLETGTKSNAVAGTQAMLERDFAAADSLFGQAESWKGAAPGQLALNRGMALASSGSDEDAMKAFQRAAALSKDPIIQADAWNNVGNLLLGGQDVEGAVGAYKEALRLDPTDADTRYNLSLALAMRQEQQDQENQDGEQDQENQDGEQDQENQDGEQDQENQDGEQDQENQDGEQDQENQDGEQDQENQDGEQDQENQDGEQDQENQDGEQDQENQDGDQNQEGQDGEKDQEGQQNGAQEQQPEPSQPKEGQIQPADAERILDMLERNEAALRAKLQAQENAKRGKGKKTKIEKDW